MITGRDERIVEMLHESGGLDLASIQIAFEMARSPAYRRVLSLERYGMIAAVRPFLRSPAIYIPTARGLREVLGREDLKAPSVGPGSYTHAIHVGHVIAELHAHGVRWQSERITRRDQKVAEIAGDRTAAKRYAIELSWLDRHHMPDVLMWPSVTAQATDQPTAIEVELTSKSARRLDEILEGYAGSLDVAGVVYVASPAALGPVASAIERLGDQGHRATVVSIFEFGPHFAAPSAPGSRRHAVETERRDNPAGTWLAQHLTSGPISALEERLRGPGRSTPTLLPAS